jgi:FMN-dependent oxidoreductase (nitrilotriacetate monooxygenase family)
MAQIHFNFISNHMPSTYVQSTWMDPADRHGTEHVWSTAHWRDLARILERGCLDGMFLVDTPTVDEEFAAETIRFGGGIPRHDPLALVPLMADATTHLGFGVTLSLAGVPPFLAVRRLGTIDNLSGGRVAWNVVTGYQRSDFRALGIAHPAHDTRYDQADEYMEICFRLWDGFPRDAIVADKVTGHFIDTGKIKKVDYDGKYHQCHAYPAVVCSPQGRPMIFQAGSSGRGMRFAAAHADAIFAVQSTVPAMQGYMKDIRAVAAQLGRPDPKVYFGIQPYLGGTAAEAQKRFRDLADKVPVDVALGRLSGLLNVDFTGVDVNKPLEEIKAPGSQGLMSALMEWNRDGTVTIRDAALRIAMSSMMMRLIGTPEQVADAIVQAWRETGCWGFNVSPHISPLSAAEFVDQVVPLLQKRGLMRTSYAGTTLRENVAQQ